MSKNKHYTLLEKKFFSKY